MKDKSIKNGSTPALVLGIIAAVFAFMPLLNNFIALPLAVIALIIAIIAIVKKNRGITAVAGLILAITAIGITFTMNSAIVEGVKTIDNAINEENESQKENTAEWTAEIYDSITIAESNFSGGSMVYNGGTQFTDIKSQVGEPTSSTEASYGNSTTVTANWTTIDWSEDSKSLSITITYEKESGQITGKNKSEF